MAAWNRRTWPRPPGRPTAPRGIEQVEIERLVGRVHRWRQHGHADLHVRDARGERERAALRSVVEAGMRGAVFGRIPDRHRRSAGPIERHGEHREQRGGPRSRDLHVVDVQFRQRIRVDDRADGLRPIEDRIDWIDQIDQEVFGQLVERVADDGHRDRPRVDAQRKRQLAIARLVIAPRHRGSVLRRVAHRRRQIHVAHAP